MGNMSYCRFENTFGDLYDCQVALEESNSVRELIERVNESEKSCVIDLIKMCKEIADSFYSEVKELEES